MGLLYSILNPTGNITALVEDKVEADRQPTVAAEIMRRHPEVEQTGFLRADGGDAPPELRMAGGEFCGNAAMCAAALILIRRGLARGELRLRVSGAAEPVTLTLRHEGAGRFEAEILMPPASEIAEARFSFCGTEDSLPLVRMQGISHLIVTPASPFYALLEDRPAAERAVRAFCEALSADGLGLLFLSDGEEARDMIPLVYIPGSGTLFWENSCASGSAAAGMYLAAQSGALKELTLREPGGVLRVSSDPARGETLLRGGVRFVGEYQLL